MILTLTPLKRKKPFPVGWLLLFLTVSSILLFLGLTSIFNLGLLLAVLTLLSLFVLGGPAWMIVLPVIAYFLGNWYQYGFTLSSLSFHYTTGAPLTSWSPTLAGVMVLGLVLVASLILLVRGTGIHRKH